MEASVWFSSCDLNTFFGLQGLVQALGIPAPAFGISPAGELVDNDHLTIA